MARHKDFHESYYEHNCVVADTEDVLKSYIPGHSFITRLKRWWFDWFLVSYSDEQARIYFTSSHALRLERYKHYRYYRDRIHPFSKFRNFQEVCMFILFFVKNVTFHHNTSIWFGQLYHGFYILGVILEWIILADVVVNCHAGYIDTQTGKIVLDKYLGLMHYGSTKLFIHVASALPLQSMLLLRYGSKVDCDLCKANNFTATLKILNCFSLLRLYEHSSFLARERNNYVVTHVLRFLRIYLLGMIIMLYYIDLSDTATLWYMLHTGKLFEEAFVSKLIWSKFVYPNPPSSLTFFVYYFERITKSFLLFNIRISKTKYQLDIIATMIGYVIAKLVYLWQIMECYDFLTRLCFLDDRIIRIKQDIDNLALAHQLPDNVSHKVSSYYNYNQSKLKYISQDNNLFVALPDILRTEVLLARHTRLFKRISYFSEWPYDLITSIVLMLREEIYWTGDLVAEPGVQSEGLFILAMGELVVYSGEVEQGHLIDGDYFGELSLVTDSEQRVCGVTAITPCVILMLEKNTFREYMRQYPQYFTILKGDILNDLGVERNTTTDFIE